MNVLSLFDGMSCGQIALNRCGIKYDNYFASEIDKHAIKVTQHNFPNTVQLGSVVGVYVSSLPKIDLLCGGSPCQSFSFAGKRKGMSTTDSIEILTLEHYIELKVADYAFEGQSYLFWEYMRILTEIRKINPDVKFLLENVEMGKKWERVLSKAIGVEGIHINSALVSAQNRRRIYWTNIGLKPAGLFGDSMSTIKQPKDKNIFLKDILEQNVPNKYYISEKAIDRINRKIYSKPQINPDKSGTPNTKNNSGQLSVDSGTTLITRNFNKVIQLNSNTESGGIQPYQQNRVYSIKGKSPAILAGMTCGSHAILENPILFQRARGFNKGGNVSRDGKTSPLTSNSWHHNHTLEHKQRIRRLTPTECERLQTVDDGYTGVISDSQRYRMLGNGWNVDTIVHILSYFLNQPND